MADHERMVEVRDSKGKPRTFRLKYKTLATVEVTHKKNPKDVRVIRASKIEEYRRLGYETSAAFRDPTPIQVDTSKIVTTDPLDEPIDQPATIKKKKKKRKKKLSIEE